MTENQTRSTGMTENRTENLGAHLRELTADELNAVTAGLVPHNPPWRSWNEA